MLTRFSITLLAAVSLLPLASSAGAAGDPGLVEIIAARSDEDKARDSSRHPQQTLDFCKVAPGMTVAEALPGSGWYTAILAPYLGSDGTLYSVNYVDRMWPLFGFATEEWVASQIASNKGFAAKVKTFTDNGIKADGFTFGTVPDKALGEVDRVLLFRALHNLKRFDASNGTLSQAMAAVRAMLADDGLVCVVQHRAPATASAEFADGNHGYLKQDDVIALFKNAGLELVASSEINANPKDQPGPDDIVWRLPPSLTDSKDDPERRAAMEAIGESDRMTLLFRKSDA